MKEGQKGIYWNSSESKETIPDSSMLEIFRQKGIEVLFLNRSNWWIFITAIERLNDHKIICVTKENFKIDETDDEKTSF
jgi:molecular chaperone HtpG